MLAEVRPAKRPDLDGMVEVYNHYVEHSAVTFDLEPVRVADRVAWFDAHAKGGPHRAWVVAEPGGRILGWATTSPFRPRPAYSTTVESSVYCRPEVARQGWGTRLYSELFRSIETADVERIVAGITLPNPASVALHERFGFRRVGTFHRVGRKLGRFWDVAWFERPVRLRKGPGQADRRTRSVAPMSVSPA